MGWARHSQEAGIDGLAGRLGLWTRVAILEGCMGWGCLVTTAGLNPSSGRPVSQSSLVQSLSEPDLFLEPSSGHVWPESGL